MCASNILGDSVRPNRENAEGLTAPHGTCFLNVTRTIILQPGPRPVLKIRLGMDRFSLADKA
jgi:hypothetical protein